MINASGLKKTYIGKDGRVDAVDAVDLCIEDSEFVAIVGSSGSGKSTLMNILGLLDRPDSGRYLLNGADVTKYSDRRLSMMRRNTIGFVFQSYNLIPRMNALENVELSQVFRGVPRSQRRKNALRALELVGLSDRIHHIPAEMSGGQQQRVAIARAIVGEPRLILADEPTGNLDSISAAQIMKILKNLNSSGVTVVLITHDREIASNAERVIQIHCGRVIGDTKQKL
jgi:putative ABC transport system ATP-binding protein